MSRSTALAERKEQVTPEQLLAVVQNFAKEKFQEARAQTKEAARGIDTMCGGQTEKLDRDVVEQGRTWATRLAIIARRQSGPNSYSPSKVAVAIQAVTKKVYAAIGELEAIVANDIEIPLFNNPKDLEQQIFGGGPYGIGDIRKAKLKDVLDGIDEEDLADPKAINQIVKDFFAESVGEHIADGVQDLLERYEVLPTKEALPDGAKPGKRGRTSGGRRAAVRRAAAEEPEEPDRDDDEVAE